MKHIFFSKELLFVSILLGIICGSIYNDYLFHFLIAFFLSSCFLYSAFLIGFYLRAKHIKKEEKLIKIVEGTEGRWNYHLSESGINGKPTVCGKTNVMSSNLKLHSWGIVTHLNESYCVKCKSIWNSKGHIIP